MVVIVVVISCFLVIFLYKSKREFVMNGWIVIIDECILFK